MADHVPLNRAQWDERAPAHARSPDYALERFRSEPDFISDVVRFDAPLLGDVAGLRGAHLQCHIGTDTISLSRLGASMVGLDFSPASLAEARRLAADCAAAVEFFEADVYDAPGVLGTGCFDLVYTGIGALCWLPHIERWAKVVEELLTPGGRLFIREGHPMLWSLADPRPDGLLVVEYPYFERDEPMVFDEADTYVETDAVFEHTLTHVWNHGLGELVTALLDRGLRLTGLVEHDSVPWEALDGQMERLGNGEYRIAERAWRVAHSFTLQAVKPA